MKEKWLLLSLIGFLISCSKQESMDALTARVFTVAEQQYLTMDTRLEVTTLPQSIASDSTFKSSTIYWWCSGFYPGSLWYIYEYTQNEAVKTLAEKNTLKLDPIQYVTNDHDVGFQLNCSYGNGFRLTGNEDYKKVLEFKTNFYNRLLSLSKDFGVEMELNGKMCGFSPYILSVSFVGIKAEVLLHSLEEKDILVGTGSACNSHHSGNRVLEGMHKSKQEVEGNIRFSFSSESVNYDAQYLAQTIIENAKKIKRK